MLVTLAAHRAVTLLLQGTEQHHLRLHGQVAYLVQKERTAIGLTEEADLILRGSRKRSLLVSEQGRCRQFLGESPTIHRNERLGRAVAVLMDGLSHMFLATAILTCYQHADGNG